MMRRAVVLAVSLAIVGCGGSDVDAGKEAPSRVDDRVPALYCLGGLGASAHPATHDIAIDREGVEVHPGGLVVRAVDAAAPLALAGVRVGDVIVEVGGEPLPNKPDPTPDFLDAVESHVSAGTGVTIGWLRAGALEHAELTIDWPPFEAGLPGPALRFSQGARRALGFLAARQGADGLFPGTDPQSQVATTGLAGLAFLASGSRLREGDFEDQVRGCYDAITAALRGDPLQGDVWGDAFATMFLAELRASSASPKLVKALASGVERLVGRQGEDGGWAAGEARDLATNQALLALGMARRVGMDVADEVIIAGCRYLKETANDGHVGRSKRADFDRRDEAGRCAGAAAALRAVNCAEGDPYLLRLVSYFDQRGTELARAPHAASLHALNAAISARQLGNRAWQTFYAKFRGLLAGVQRPDGSCHWIPRDALRLAFEGELWDTACLAVALGLQEGHVPVLTAEHAVDGLAVRDSDGAVVEGAAPTEAAAKPKMHGGENFIKLDGSKDIGEQLEGLGLPQEEIDKLKKQIEDAKAKGGKK